MTSVTSSELDTSLCSDVAYNDFSTRLATAGPGGSVAVWDRVSGSPPWQLSSRWASPDTSLAKVAWAHPEYGQVLATSSADGLVRLWQELPRAPGPAAAAAQPPGWRLSATLADSRQPVTALEFAPKEQGLRLAVGSADGCVRFYTASAVLAAEQWELENDLRAAQGPGSGPGLGCQVTALAWRQAAPGLPWLLLVGTSQGAQVWYYRASLMRWQLAVQLGGGQPAAAVSWAPLLGRPRELVAVASGARVTVYGLQGRADAMQAEEVAVLEHSAPVWRVAFNQVGTWLACASAEGEVALWRPSLVGDWRRLLHVEPGDAPGTEQGFMGAPAGQGAPVAMMA